MSARSSEILKKAPVSTVLITNLVNIRYLTGLQLSAGVVLLTKKAITLFVDGRYTEKAKQEAAKGVVVKSIDAFPAALAKARRCGFEDEDVTVARLNRWKKAYKNTKFVQVSGLIEGLRRQKTTQELRAFKRAQKITHVLMKKVPSFLKPGVTELQVAWQLQTLANKLGAEGMSFEPIVAFGPNSSRPHHRGSNRKLRKRDIVQIDTGVRFGGYCADQSQMFFLGKPTAAHLRVLKAVSEAKTAATAAVKAGAKASEIDAISRKVLKKYGYAKYFIHALGHGVGIEIHEAPTLSTKSKDVLLKGDIVTIEPGVYFPGKFGIRLEDEVIVK